MQEDLKATRIRQLNDRLRCRSVGGRIVITRGLAALREESIARILRAVAAFDDFSEDNDPRHEHDCAVLTVDGVRIIWKIDYFDPHTGLGSGDPADTARTSRVLTIMLADEY